MDINTLVTKLFDSKPFTPFVMRVRDGLGVKVAKFKRKKRWCLDTDLYGYSNFDYSEEGQEKLKSLATNSPLSDGVKIESWPGKRVFCISFDDDAKEGLKHTYGVWLEAIRSVLLEKNCVIDISKE